MAITELECRHEMLFWQPISSFRALRPRCQSKRRMQLLQNIRMQLIRGALKPAKKKTVT
ncbi:hypothetical protein GBA52_017173 [Prunus armeniaca]|nr:hypothetical protein GBA52_017173 [Prunus armeniaca]